MKHTQTLYIHSEWSTYDKKFNFVFMNTEITWDNSRTLIATQEIEFDLPDEGMLRKKAYDGFMKERGEVLASAQVKANALEARAQELLALEDHSND